MCQTSDLGGKCCPVHTRPHYDSLIKAMDAKASKTPFNKGDGRKQARSAFSALADDGTSLNHLNVVANYASTTLGAKQVAADITRYKGEGDIKTVAFLTSAVRCGQTRGETAKEAAAAIKKVKDQAIRKVTGSRMELKRSTKATPEWNMATEFPGVAELWDDEGNNGILPTEVTPNTNGSIRLRCPEHGSWDGGRGNNLVVPIKSGKRFYPICPECEGRRPRLFAATQAEYGSLVDALGDTDAWDRLSPALQYECLAEMGHLRGSANSMSRQIGMSIVHGDLTLTDMVNATDANKIKVREDLDDDEAVATISDLDLDDTTAKRTRISSLEAEADEFLALTGALTVINPEGALATDIAREINDGLWKQACDPKTDIDAYVALLDSRRGHNTQRDTAIDRFTTELAAVQNMDLPDGYNPERTDADGTARTLTPTLAQMRFAATVVERRRYMNWSGTGAGKTLSATLAVQSANAQETLVVCPNNVTSQWEAEFSGGFPETTEVRRGLPNPSQPLKDAAPGVNRVWVVNYDKFQADATVLRHRIGSLADRVDAIIFDEIQMAKASTAAETSKRHKALLEFTDRAGAANPALVVIGASATPVVNDLDEAKSVLRIVEGPDLFASFPTKPTMKNAATAHRRLAAAGTRHMPIYPSTLTRRETIVDISGDLHTIQARVNALRAKSESGQMHPAMMEKALLPYRLPAIVSAAVRNKTDGNGPTLLYSYYTTDMIAPMRDALEAADLRVGTFIGDDSDAERAEALRQFKSGEIDVLIGSRCIGVGVDGLQHVSSQLLVASPAWTASDDDQLVGRLQRRGQLRNVSVTYIITEAVVGEARWSWDADNRLRRIQFKRGLADAVMDGVLPDGALDSSHHGAEQALAGLQDMLNARVAA